MHEWGLKINHKMVSHDQWNPTAMRSATGWSIWHGTDCGRCGLFDGENPSIESHGLMAIRSVLRSMIHITSTRYLLAAYLIIFALFITIYTVKRWWRFESRFCLLISLLFPSHSYLLPRIKSLRSVSSIRYFWAAHYHKFDNNPRG